MLSLGSLVCKYYDIFVASRLLGKFRPKGLLAWRSKSEQSNTHLALIYVSS